MQANTTSYYESLLSLMQMSKTCTTTKDTRARVAERELPQRELVWSSHLSHVVTADSGVIAVMTVMTAVMTQ